MAATKEPRWAMALGATALTTLSAGASEAVPVGGGFAATVNGLVIEGDPSLDDATQAGLALRVFERGAQFAIGDFVLYVEDRFGEEAAQVVDPDLGWSLKTISNYRWIASRIAPERRRMERLGIRHHQLVAPLTPAKQQYWLTKAAADDEPESWTVARLKKALVAGEDVPVTGWTVIVTCPNGQVQAELMDRLEAEGLSCKAGHSRRGKKVIDAAA